MKSRILLMVLAILLIPGAVRVRAQDPKREYLMWMEENLPECSYFETWQMKTRALPPDFESLPRTNLLPDAFTFSDGSPVVTDADWERRRAEILDLFIRYEFGTLPPKPGIRQVQVLEDRKDDGSRTLNVNLWFGPDIRSSVRASVTIPAGRAREKYPVVLSPKLGGLGSDLLQRGYISAGFAGGDALDDSRELRDVYPDYTFSTLTKRAWLVSIVLDWLETLPEVDMERVALYGYSRDGKMAAIAAALDSRVSALVAGSTGVGGLLPWRYASERGGGESIESFTRMFPDWFIPELRFFSGREDRLPVDANLLLDLIAPRAVLMEWGLNDEVVNGWALERVYEASLPVYARYGAEDRLSLLRMDGFHGNIDLAACLDFLDVQFGRSERKWNYSPTFSWDWNAWAANHRLDVSGYPAHRPDEPLARNRRDWEKRRPALLEAVRQMLGNAPEAPSVDAPQPDPAAPDIPAWVIGRGMPEFGWIPADNYGMATRRIRFGSEGLRGDLYYPENTPEGTRLPVVIWLHGYHFPLGYMWVYHPDTHPIPALVREGFAVLAFDQTGFGSRSEEYAPFYDRWPEWSRLGRMVSDVQDAITALENDPLVDPERINLLGFALGGTVGLYAAALDTRVRNVVSVCGFTPMRSDTGADGLSGMTRYSHLHNLLPRLGWFAGQEELLPYDFGDLIALTAPRGVLIVQPSMDRDADPEAVRRAVEYASAAYAWEGAATRIGPRILGPGGSSRVRLELREPEDYGRLTARTQIPVFIWLLDH